MLLTEIDHVAIAVNDLEAAIDYYKRAFGATVTHREVVEQDGVEEALQAARHQAHPLHQWTARELPDFGLHVLSGILHTHRSCHHKHRVDVPVGHLHDSIGTCAHDHL